VTASTPSSRPSIAELRAVTQPRAIFERTSGEHWAGRLYMRRLSPYLTQRLLATSLSADTITWLMVPVGLAAALALTIPGPLGGVGAVLLVQLQMLLDCSDGELARWRGSFGPKGIYADRFAHHVTDAALACALGIRADGGWDSIGGWTTIGLVLAILVLLIKAESTLVHVARAASGLPVIADTSAAARPRSAGLARVRRAIGRFPFYRAFVTMEMTLLALVGAVVDLALGDLSGTRAVVLVLVPVGLVTVAGHLVATVASDRLR
jgi:phosphatidylglycerophosphate synthase